MDRILVGVDDSVRSDAPLRWAIAHARDAGATLEVLHAWTYPATSGFPLASPPPPREQLEADAAAVIDGSLARVGGAGGIQVVKTVVPGPAPLALVRASEHADLLVVGKGHDELGGRMLGSVSEYCLAHAECPVTVVPG